MTARHSESWISFFVHHFSKLHEIRDGSDEEEELFGIGVMAGNILLVTFVMKLIAKIENTC